MQDFLSLGKPARMNFPGKSSGNWTWRMPADSVEPALARSLRDFNFVYGRMPEKKEENVAVKEEEQVA